MATVSTAAVPQRNDPAHEYPWTGQSSRSAVLLAGGIVDLAPEGGPTAPAEQRQDPLIDAERIDALLAQEDAPPLAERTLVLAVGSNQTPETIARKYVRSGMPVRPATPFVRCTVRNLAVGHCATVAARGYIPAAPFRADGERVEMVATWFDDEQLAVVDETEPNYDRIALDAQLFPITLATGHRPAHVDVYASRWGVIGEQAPIPLHHEQAGMFAELLSLTGAEILAGDAAEVCARLAEAPETIRELTARHDLVRDDALLRPIGD